MEVKDPAAIRRGRKSKGFTQRELAYLVKRSHTTIYAIETGRLKAISEDLTCAIAARLERDWEDLFITREIVAMPTVATGLQCTEPAVVS